MWLGIFDGSALVRCTEPVEWLHVTGRLKVPGCWWPRSYCNWSPAVNALGVLLLFQPFSPLFLSLFLSLSLCLNSFFYFFLLRVCKQWQCLICGVRSSFSGCSVRSVSSDAWERGGGRDQPAVVGPLVSLVSLVSFVSFPSENDWMSFTMDLL